MSIALVLLSLIGNLLEAAHLAISATEELKCCYCVSVNVGLGAIFNQAITLALVLVLVLLQFEIG